MNLGNFLPSPTLDGLSLDSKETQQLHHRGHPMWVFRARSRQDSGFIVAWCPHTRRYLHAYLDRAGKFWRCPGCATRIGTFDD